MKHEDERKEAVELIVKAETSGSLADAISAAAEVSAAVKKMREEGSMALADAVEERAKRHIGDMMTLAELRERFQMQWGVVQVAPGDSIEDLGDEAKDELCMLTEMALSVNGFSLARLNMLVGAGAATLIREVLRSTFWRDWLRSASRRAPMVGIIKNLALTRVAEVLGTPATTESERKEQIRVSKWAVEAFFTDDERAYLGDETGGVEEPSPEDEADRWLAHLERSTR
jgi:hypothetical protein